MLDLQVFSLFFLAFISLLLSYTIYSRPKQSSTPYPPGPVPRPIIGNLFDVPFSKKPWLKYLEWSRRLDSAIVHMSVVRTHIVVLHRLEDATTLLVKRSAIYSERPVMPVCELLGMESGTGLLPCGDRWRKHRRIFQEAIGKEQAHWCHYIMEMKVHLLLGELLNDPGDFSEHFKWLAASFALAATVGYDVPPGRRNDRIVLAADSAGKALTELVVPGRTLINVFPFLGRIPPWVPGAYTQRLASTIKRSVVRYKSELFDYVRKNMAENMHKDSILAKLLQNRKEKPGSGYDDNILQDVMSTMYHAGVDTVLTAQMTFILALALHPEQQRKAQAEIDRIVGTDRLPTFDDRASLPYVEALHREVRRWRPVLPLGGPHSTVKDDVYNGFYIPKGAIVMSNIWAITRDATRYHDADNFIPERFFNLDGTLNEDTVDYGFGFGRRVCPGRYVADSLIWLALVCTLSTFSISKARGGDGNEIDIDAEAFHESLLARPLPFKCSIVPRSNQAEALIHDAVLQAHKGQ